MLQPVTMTAAMHMGKEVERERMHVDRWKEMGVMNLKLLTSYQSLVGIWGLFFEAYPPEAFIAGCSSVSANICVYREVL